MLLFSLAFHALALALIFVFATIRDDAPQTPTLRVKLVAAPLAVVVNGQHGQDTQAAAAPRIRRGAPTASASATIPTPNGLLKSSSLDLLPQGTLDILAGERPAPSQHGPSTDLHDAGGWKATTTREGRVAFKDKLPMPWSFDLTDLVMKVRGETLDVPTKKRFLEATRAQRLQMARDLTDENLAQSVIDIRSQLLSIEDNPRLTLLEKKEQLFAMWDDCAEEGSEEVLNTSALIRSMIFSFIAHHFPAGSERAYSAAELAKLNGSRGSKSEFSPYSGS